MLASWVSSINSVGFSFVVGLWGGRFRTCCRPASDKISNYNCSTFLRDPCSWALPALLEPAGVRLHGRPKERKVAFQRGRTSSQGPTGGDRKGLFFEYTCPVIWRLRLSSQQTGLAMIDEKQAVHNINKRFSFLQDPIFFYLYVFSVQYLSSLLDIRLCFWYHSSFHSTLLWVPLFL